MVSSLFSFADVRRCSSAFVTCGFHAGWTVADATGRPFAGLESVCGFTPTVGSNPTATANLTRDLPHRRCSPGFGICAAGCPVSGSVSFATSVVLAVGSGDGHAEFRDRRLQLGQVAVFLLVLLEQTALDQPMRDVTVRSR
jgi:hypothetical protein